MNTLELKGSILERLANIQDADVLDKINQFLIQLSKPTTNKVRSPEWLSDEQILELENALEKIKDEKNLVPHEEFFKKYRTWSK